VGIFFAYYQIVTTQNAIENTGPPHLDIDMEIRIRTCACTLEMCQDPERTILLHSSERLRMLENT
jgi:hypothetical protein